MFSDGFSEAGVTTYCCAAICRPGGLADLDDAGSDGCLPNRLVFAAFIGSQCVWIIAGQAAEEVGGATVNVQGSNATLRTFLKSPITTMHRQRFRPGDASPDPAPDLIRMLKRDRVAVANVLGREPASDGG